MPKQILELPVKSLRKGLYVSRLDRPWIESPFLFQGFEIASDQELALLRGLCQKVYVEVTEVEARELAGFEDSNEGSVEGQSSALRELAEKLTARVDRVPLKDPVSLKGEMGPARNLFGEARRTVTQIFDRLRRGGGLDVQMMENVVDSMIDSIFRNREAMSWLARMKTKDDYLYNHSLAASVWALAFGRHLGLDKDTLRSLGTGAMLLDIGKTKLPTELLQKRGKPEPAEWELLKGHVHLSLEIISKDPRVDASMQAMIRTHHERLDGSGYPNQLSGEQIPLVGRIAGIVDCYDAMTSDRLYAKGKSTYEAILELKKLRSSWFQSELVELFIQAVGVFPTGTLVELSSGEVAIVIAQNRFRRLRPEVMLILDAQKKMRAEFTQINLQNYARNNDAGNSPLWILQGLEPGAFGIDPTEFFL